jgi:hypothetical protein
MIGFPDIDREGGDSYVNAVKSFNTVLTELAAYVKKWHTTGLSWNARVRTQLT